MNLNGLIESVISSRKYFLRHLEGLPDEAWTFKPFSECKNILETQVHLRNDDEMAAESILTKEEPDYETATIGAYEEVANGPDVLLNRLAVSHQRLLDLIRSEFSSESLNGEICIWGSMKPLYRGVPYLSSEDFYHAGQVAFVRMAIQPDWNYYGDIYGAPADQP